MSVPVNSICLLGADLAMFTRAALATVVFSLFGLPVSAAAASSETVQRHVDKATVYAGSDLTSLLTLCKPASAKKMSHQESEKYIGDLMAKPIPVPGQAFDDLYYVGANWVSAWALRTSKGIILFDALNNDEEAEQVIDKGMRALGLDPKQIKYVVVTHGHGDHYGGLGYLIRKYHPRVVMSSLDWKMIETKLDFESEHWGKPPKRDVVVNDGDTVTLGDTIVTLHLTPGHTVGTLSPSFAVHSQGQVHQALLWGGTAFNFGKNMSRLQSYIDSTEQMITFTRLRKVDVLLSNHAGYDNTFDKLKERSKQSNADNNPFVLGTESVVRGLSVMGECARAQFERFEQAN